MSKVKTISLPLQKINFDTDIIIDREDIIYYDTKKYLNLIKFKKMKSDSSIPMKSKIDSKSLSNRKLSGTTSQSSSNRMSPIKNSKKKSDKFSSRLSHIKGYSGKTLESSSSIMSAVKDTKKKSDKS